MNSFVFLLKKLLKLREPCIFGTGAPTVEFNRFYFSMVFAENFSDTAFVGLAI